MSKPEEEEDKIYIYNCSVCGKSFFSTDKIVLKGKKQWHGWPSDPNNWKGQIIGHFSVFDKDTEGSPYR